MGAFLLTADLLAQHSAGRMLALFEDALGGSYSFTPHRLGASNYEVRARASIVGLLSTRASVGTPTAGPAGPDSDPDSSGDDDAQGSDVAIAQVRGLLEARANAWMCGWSDGYDAIVERFAAAHADRRVGAVVLQIGSPGGDGEGLLEACFRMAAIAAASGKATFGYIDEKATSAAYAIASIVCTAGLYGPQGMLAGSIGVRTEHEDRSAANAKEGITRTHISDLPGKVLGNPDAPLDDAAKAMLQQRVTTLGDQFRAAVSVARDLPVASLVALNAKVLIGQEAVDAGLVDDLASFEAVLSLAAASASVRLAAMNPIAPPMGAPVPPPAALPPPAPPGASPAMRTHLPTLRAAAGVPPTVSDVELEAALVPKLALLTRVQALAGTTDAAELEGKISAALLLAPTAAKSQVAETDRVAKAETEERHALVLQLVTSSPPRMAPAEAWKHGATGPDPKLGVADLWAGMPIASLRAMATQLKPLALAAAVEPSRQEQKDVGAAGSEEQRLLATLTTEERSRCTASGRDPLDYARAKTLLPGTR